MSVVIFATLFTLTVLIVGYLLLGLLPMILFLLLVYWEV